MKKRSQNQKFDFSEGHNFFRKKIGRYHLGSGASHNPFYSLKLKPQILGEYFREKLKSFKKLSKNREFDFFEGHSLLSEKI